MRKSILYFFVLGFLAVTFGCATSRSDGHTGRGSLVTIRLPNGMYVTKKVVSMREGRYKNVVPQKFDLSCGAASLATILNYFYNHEVDEIDIIKYMLDQGDEGEISQKGFSLLDLKKYAIHKGYLADGYKVQLKALRKLKIPAVILFKSGKYSHFVVFKGMRDDKVYIADPAYGNRSMSIKNFEDNWNGIIFLVASRDKQNQTPLPLETTLPAPVLSVMRIQQLVGGGFASFKGPGEF
jgi:predicted double-glycine peptidase